MSLLKMNEALSQSGGNASQATNAISPTAGENNSSPMRISAQAPSTANAGPRISAIAGLSAIAPAWRTSVPAKSFGRTLPSRFALSRGVRATATSRGKLP